MERKTIKRIAKTVGIIAGLLIFNKLFVIPYKNPGRISRDIVESKKAKAFMYECRVIDVDTLLGGYNFPVTRMWVEKSWELGRNRWGLVVSVADPNPRYERIIFDILKDDTFFIRKDFTREWVIRDSLTHRVGSSNNVINQDWHYTKGDTAVFNIYKKKGQYLSIWKVEDMIPIFQFKVAAD